MISRNYIKNAEGSLSTTTAATFFTAVSGGSETDWHSLDLATRTYWCAAAHRFFYRVPEAWREWASFRMPLAVEPSHEFPAASYQVLREEHRFCPISGLLAHKSLDEIEKLTARFWANPEW
jgi:hypothetical protein